MTEAERELALQAQRAYERVAVVATRDAERLAATTDSGGPLAGTAERVSELRP
jgi:hypothetical protein